MPSGGAAPALGGDNHSDGDVMPTFQGLFGTLIISNRESNKVFGVSARDLVLDKFSEAWDTSTYVELSRR